MDRTYYLNLNCQYRDARLSAMDKLKEISSYLTFIEDHKKQNPSSTLTELMLPVGYDDIKKFAAIYIDDPQKKHVFIRGHNGKYLSSENGEAGMRCDRDVPLHWEKFTIEEFENGKFIALKSMGKYVSSEWGLFSMKCNRKKAEAWELFEITEHGDNVVSFNGNNKRFVTTTEDGKKLFCYAKEDKEGEKFHLQRLQSPEGELEIGWTLLNKHLIALCDDYDAAEAERDAIDTEVFYYMKPIEVKHHGRGNSYTTQHEERLFNVEEFKGAVKVADKKILAAQEALDKHAQHINILIADENKRAQEITKMFNLCSPVLQNLANQNKSAATASAPKVTNENDYGFVY